MDLTNMWFQQDGAIWGFHHIAWRGHWQLRLCDLTPFYEALCAVKPLLCANQLQAIAVRNPNLTRVFQEIEPHLCEYDIQNWSTYDGLLLKLYSTHVL